MSAKPTAWLTRRSKTEQQEYRRQISGKTRPVSGEDVFTKIPKAKGYYVSRKYDGEFAMLIWDGENLISVNPGGTVRVGLPCYEEAEKLLKKAKIKEALFGAEIYLMTDVTRAHPVQQVVRVLRAPKSVNELDKLGLAVFDIIEIDGKPVETTKGVFDKLKKIFGKGKRVHPPEMKVADTTGNDHGAIHRLGHRRGCRRHRRPSRPCRLVQGQIASQHRRR